MQLLKSEIDSRFSYKTLIGRFKLIYFRPVTDQELLNNPTYHLVSTCERPVS